MPGRASKPKKWLSGLSEPTAARAPRVVSIAIVVLQDRADLVGHYVLAFERHVLAADVAIIKTLVGKPRTARHFILVILAILTWLIVGVGEWWRWRRH